MKLMLLSFALLGGISANAQLLPIPGKKNPDWVLINAEPQPYDAQALAIPAPAPTDRMPNAAKKSIRSIGNQRYYWDADRQLAYNWYSKEGKTEPDIMVFVREQRKDIVYTYRRANAEIVPPSRSRK
jgi:hypothetical protein